jgi:hypothetical protein
MKLPQRFLCLITVSVLASALFCGASAQDKIRLAHNALESINTASTWYRNAFIPGSGSVSTSDIYADRGDIA